VAAIAPNSDIYLLHDVPLDNTFQHSIWFLNATNQHNYFYGKRKRSFSAQTYQRVHRYKIRLQVVSDDIYDCNYLMFRNTNFGNKWFYAFITEAEYINNSVTEITYEIDPLQTWFFDYNLKPCFVERQHSESDEIGEHILPEPVETGEYVFNNFGTLPGTANAYVIVATGNVQSFDPSAQASSGNIYSRTYGGLTLKAFSAGNKDAINQYVASFLQQPDAVVSMYMCPALLIEDTVPATGLLLDNTNTCRAMSEVAAGEVPGINSTMTLNGYKPHNNKMYTYPYNFLMLNNGMGDSLNLRYEFFDNLTPVLEYGGNVTQPVGVICRPKNYKGNEASTKTESLFLSNFPVCSWNVDSYDAWAAQNSVGFWGGKVLGGGVSIGAGIAGALLATNPIAAATIGVATGVGAISKATSVVTEMYEASIKADQVRGNTTGGSANFAVGSQAIYHSRMSVTYDYARMIDGFFDMFGYSVKRMKQPVIWARKHYTYVKTAGCVITGTVPADDSDKICKIFDTGITFWTNGDEVGNYTTCAPDNTPVGS